MHSIVAFVVLYLVLQLNTVSTTECEDSYSKLGTSLNKCMTAVRLPTKRTLRNRFAGAFLVQDPDINKQKLFVQSVCYHIKVSLDCHLDYHTALITACPDMDENRVIEIFSLQIVINLHEYLCGNNMSKILDIFENDGVRFIHNNDQLSACAYNVPNINTITLVDDLVINNTEFCMSLRSGFECVHIAFETALNKKLKPMIEDIYNMIRDVVQCNNGTTSS